MTTDTATIESLIARVIELLEGLSDPRFDGLRRVFARDPQWLGGLSQDLPGALAGAVGSAVPWDYVFGSPLDSRFDAWAAVQKSAEYWEDPATLQALVRALER